MTQQTLMWTALPNGHAADRKLRLSVMLSPRLAAAEGGKQLLLSSFFPLWRDWPSVLRKAVFEVTFGGTTIEIKYITAGSNRIDDDRGMADSNVWKALFHGKVPVTPYRYADQSGKTVLSYATVLMHRKIEAIYRKLASKATDDMPLVRDFLKDPEWAELIDAVSNLDRTHVDQATGLRDPRKQFVARRQNVPKLLRASGAIVPFSEPQNPVLANFDDFQLFHTPSGNPILKTSKRNDDDRIEYRALDYQPQDLPDKEDLAAQLDFHQIVAAMGSYPILLRKLGLVVDLLLDPKQLPATPAGDLSVRVALHHLRPGHQSRSIGLVTRALLSDNEFRAISNPSANTAEPSQFEGGLLKLVPTDPRGHKQFAMVQMDVDSAGLKLMNFARTLGRRGDAHGVRSVAVPSNGAGESHAMSIVVQPQTEGLNRIDPVTRHEERVGAPSLRTAGLMLIHNDRKSALNQRLMRNTECHSAVDGHGALSLHAEDLIRGYRLDIWDSTTRKWHSLCQRTARYELGGDAGLSDERIVVNVASEEGTIRLAATRSANVDSQISDFLYLSEVVASWTGWSLAAPPPGRAIGPKYDAAAPDTPNNPHFVSEGETPPGLSFRSTFKPERGSLPRLRFGRSYWIRARAVDLAGNSLEFQPTDFGAEDPDRHKVSFLRYEPLASPIVALLSRNGIVEMPAEGESMGCIAIRSLNDAISENSIPTSELAHRAVVPPRVSVREAEQHGCLDGQDGKVGSHTFDLLASKKDLCARDGAAAVREFRVSSQESSSAETVHAVYEADRLLTYLPDPLALEVAVRIFDHPYIADTEIVTVPLYPTGGWPEAQPFLIEVYEDSDPAKKPYFDDGRRLLRLPLPKAFRAKMRMSMKPNQDCLNKLAIFALLSDVDKKKQLRRALAGQHWMLTPWRAVEVVHAVQRPLIAPKMTSLTIDKGAIGATSATPIIEASCSVRSTDRLDLQAIWHEPIDDVDLSESECGPADRTRHDMAFSVKVTDPKDYSARSKGFPAGGCPDHTIIASDVVGINVVTDAEAMDSIATKAHEFHDTRYRRIEYWIDATTRFREFLPSDLLTKSGVPVEDHIKVNGPRSVTWIPNSGPPPAPSILYVVPTFGWTRTMDAEFCYASLRKGGGLRVYLDRPWNVSGYGEMLAVVLPRAGFGGDPDAEPAGHPYKRYVTQWGNDPIWDSPSVSGIAPTRDKFPRARYAPDASGYWLPPGAPATERDQAPGPFRVTELHLPNSQGKDAGAKQVARTLVILPDPGVEVAPHDVFYDAERQLWYCDIEIDAGASYFPFVRLALARYQPISIAGAHLSNVVLADFAALTMDRWLVVIPMSTDRVAYKVSVFGMGFRDSSAHHEAARAHATAELTPVKVDNGNIIEVWVERLDPRLGEDFGWQRLSDVAVTQQQAGDTILTRPVEVVHSWEMLWAGDVVLPFAPNGCDRYRLVVAEYEQYLVDDERPYDQVPTSKGRRLVYAEHVELA